MSTLKTLLIGSGRLARHLEHWFQLNKSTSHSISLAQTSPEQKLLVWNRKDSIEQLNELSASADIIWLAISDKSIVPFFDEHLLNSKAKVVHFSGALFDSRIFGAHPLMSFPQELLESEVYGQIQFAVDESIANLRSILPGFQNSYFKIPSDKKAMYHALCVTSGNFPQLLWSLCAKEFMNLDVPERAFELYILQITKLFLTHKEKSFTGPLVRGDSETIEKNISALNQNPSLSAIYKTFAEVYKHEN